MDREDSLSPQIPEWLSNDRKTELNLSETGSVLLGNAMPPLGNIPLLTDEIVLPVLSVNNKQNDIFSTPAINNTGLVTVSSLETGWVFNGKAHIAGGFTIACQFQGAIEEVFGSTASVVVTETGVVNADITASSVSIMGSYSGNLDASGGKVELHSGSVIAGHVKYGQLQVNGADLNATLERVSSRHVK